MAYAFRKEDEDFLHDTWTEWTRAEKLGKYKLGMSYMDLRHLYKFFLDTLKKSGIPSTSSIPPYWGELWDIIDNTLSRGENEEAIEREVRLQAPHTPMEIEAAVEEGETEAEILGYLESMADDLGKRVVSKEMAEKVDELEATVGALKEEKTRRRLTERGLEEAIQKVRSLQDLLAKKEAELKARPPAQIFRLRVLKDFKEELVTYREGTILELSTKEEIEWAKKKMLEGLLEEVPLIEKPPVAPPPSVKVVPPTPIFKPRPALSTEELEEIRRDYKRKFEVDIRTRDLPIRESMLRFDDLFSGWRDDVEHLAFPTRDEALKALEDELRSLLETLQVTYKPEVKPPIPIAAPAWDHAEAVKIYWDVRSIFEAANIDPDLYRDEAYKLIATCASPSEARVKLREWAEAKIRELTRVSPPRVRPEVRPMPPRLEPPDIAPLDWVQYIKGIDLNTWTLKMSPEERKTILDEYERLCWNNVRKRRGLA